MRKYSTLDGKILTQCCFIIMLDRRFATTIENQTEKEKAKAQKKEDDSSNDHSFVVILGIAVVEEEAKV